MFTFVTLALCQQLGGSSTNGDLRHDSIYSEVVNYQSLVAALARASADLGSLPEFVALRPKLQIHLYDELASTNQTAWQLVDRGHRAGTVVIAAQQTAGRGQWGRTWVSARGGLYLSLVLEPEMVLAHKNLLTLTSAWGVAASLDNLGIPLQIKWPNDLVSQGRKVGGILTESRVKCAPTGGSESQIQQVVIGLGLNWDNPLPEKALSVRQLLPDLAIARVKTLEDLAAIALRGLLQCFYYWQQYGDEAFLQAYQQRLADRGKEVTVDGHPAVVKGVSLRGDLIVSGDRGDEEFVRSLKPGEISLGYNV